MSCFIFTTNHLPTWMEEGERRYYMLDTDHDGHASGPAAAAFSAIVTSTYKALADDEAIARLYNYLLARKLQPDFDPKTLNTTLHGTELMKRVGGASRQISLMALEEFLAREGRPVQPQDSVTSFIVQELRQSRNSTRHLMVECGWTQHLVKWGGADYARAIWASPGYTVSDGNVLGPDGYKKAVCDVLWDEAVAAPKEVRR